MTAPTAVSAGLTPTPDADEKTPFRYTANIAGQIELHWQARWEAEDVFRAPNPGEDGFDATRPKYYCLDMFPYPSGAGLHVGHPEGYTATDILCRYKRMTGHAVLHPMGWDAFGLPAEQYAIQTGVHPDTTTRTAIDNFRRQLKRFGFCYDWSREFATIDPDYYKWTQWIWLRLYDSWFDEEASSPDGKGKARPISELIESLERSEMMVGPSGEFVRTGRVAHATEALSGSAIGARAWHEFSADEQREIIDSQRLAYLSEQTVNWCPKLGTALANEEVINGRSERGSFPVFRKPMRQWMLRITAYAERLLDGLGGVDWPNSTKLMQQEWIGKSRGAEVDFPLDAPEGWAESFVDDDGAPGAIRVFTTRPDTIFGATFMVLAPEHPIVNAAIALPPEGVGGADSSALRAYVQVARNKTDVERQENKEKTGVFTGLYAINPANNEKIPVWCADYVLMSYGHGAIMAVPGQDERDWEFAEMFDLSIVRTVKPPAEFKGKAYTGDGEAMNSGFLDGLSISDAKKRAIEWLEEENVGAARTNYRLRDWLFSRQRYWGEPFPLVFDEAGNHYPVGDSALPVVLPPMADYQPIESDNPKPLLAKATDWVRTTAGEAGVDPALLAPETPVTRETNTMPGWAGSCWYYLRYCSPKDGDRLVDAQAERYWMGDGGVNLYIGGAEHAVLHLLYARFWHKVLFDLGVVGTSEPFRKLFHQGLITSFAYQRADKTLVPVDEVAVDAEGNATEIATGEKVAEITAKMSKSLKNVVNPDDVIAEYGADTFRLYEMYMGPLEASKPWNTDDTIGLYRFIQRVWRLVANEATSESTFASAQDDDIERALHKAIDKVTGDLDRMGFNTAIAAMIEFVNAATPSGAPTGNSPLTASQAARFAQILAPFAPHVAEEIWARTGSSGFVCNSPWPEADSSMLLAETVEIPVQVMGKVRAKIQVPAGVDDKTLEELALADERVQGWIEGKTVRKVIVVSGRLVNIVAN